MISKSLRIGYILILLSLAGCADLASLLTTPTPIADVSHGTSPAQVTATPQPVPSVTETPPALVEARVLRLWLPPSFDPNAGTPSANLLKQRLADFQLSHPGLKIDVRIKDAEG